MHLGILISVPDFKLRILHDRIFEFKIDLPIKLFQSIKNSSRISSNDDREMKIDIDQNKSPA